MPKKQKVKAPYNYLLIILAVFIIGTLIDVSTKYFLNFAIGGLGASSAALVGIYFVYHQRRERIHWRALLPMLRISWPHFKSKLDIIFVVLVIISAGIAIWSIASQSSHPAFSRSLLLYALSAAILPPLIEEFLDRGFIQSALERMNFSTPIVIGTSAVIFSLSHIPVNPSVVPLTFVAGLCFGIITLRTRSIVLPFVIHGVWNLLIVLLVS